MKVFKTVIDWLLGVGITEVELSTNERLVTEVHYRAKWLSDAQLAELMNACEVEQVNRLAQAAGYYDMEEDIWVAAQANNSIKLPASAG